MVLKRLPILNKIQQIAVRWIHKQYSTINTTHYPTPYNYYHPMEANQTEFTIKCPQGNTAASVCANPKCSPHILMCEDRKCQCRKQHKYCGNQFVLDNFKAMMERKGSSYRQVAEGVEILYESWIKLLTIEIGELRKSMAEHRVHLAEDEDKLYRYLVEGKSELVTSQLLAEVNRSLFEERERDHSEELKLIKEGEEKFRQIIDSIKGIYPKQTSQSVESVPSLETLPLPSLQTSKFTKELSNLQFTIIDNHTIRSRDGSFKAACLQPSLLGSVYKSCKYRFVLNRITYSNLMLGVIQLTPDIDIYKGFIFDEIQYGALMNQENYVYLGKSEGHKKQSINITQFFTNDVVEVEYQLELKRVTVRNVTKNQQGVAYIAVDPTLPLYVTVILLHTNDQIKLIGVQYRM